MNKPTPNSCSADPITLIFRASQIDFEISNFKFIFSTFFLTENSTSLVENIESPSILTWKMSFSSKRWLFHPKVDFFSQKLTFSTWMLNLSTFWMKIFHLAFFNCARGNIEFFYWKPISINFNLNNKFFIQKIYLFHLYSWLFQLFWLKILHVSNFEHFIFYYSTFLVESIIFLINCNFQDVFFTQKLRFLNLQSCKSLIILNFLVETIKFNCFQLMKLKKSTF